jgi:hypothetical protein
MRMTYTGVRIYEQQPPIVWGLALLVERVL